MIWAILPWRRCRAVLEKKGDSSAYGRCDRTKKHEGLHALERGFDVVWFSTSIESTLCNCTAHDITEIGASHANDCPAYDGPNPMWFPEPDAWGDL